MINSGESRKIVPIRRRVIELNPPNIPSVTRSISAFTSLTISLFLAYQHVAKLRIKHYKKSKIIFNAESLTRRLEFEWVDQSMKVVYKLNRADSTARYKLKLNGATDRCIVRKNMIKMKNIAEFSFNFSSLYSYGDDELSILEHIMKRQKYIRETNLNFKRMETLDDKKVRKVCHILSKSRNNKSLALSFSENKKITRKGFDYIFGQIKRMSQLENLELNLKGANCFGSVEANSLEHSLKNLKKLRRLNLNISECPLITERELNNIKSHLSHMYHLKKLTINDEPVDIGPFPIVKKINFKYLICILAFYILFGYTIHILIKIKKGEINL